MEKIRTDDGEFQKSEALQEKNTFDKIFSRC